MVKVCPFCTKWLPSVDKLIRGAMFCPWCYKYREQSRKELFMDCPFIDENEPRCSGCLNMQHLGETFEFCVDQYTLCPLYLELSNKKMVPTATVPGK